VLTKNFSSLFCVIGVENVCLVNMFVLLYYEFLNFVTALSEVVSKLHNQTSMCGSQSDLSNYLRIQVFRPGHIVAINHYKLIIFFNNSHSSE